MTTLLSLTERYCVVYQTLAGGVPVSIDSDGRIGQQTGGNE
jgi:hypothetical protein